MLHIESAMKMVGGRRIDGKPRSRKRSPITETKLENARSPSEQSKLWTDSGRTSLFQMKRGNLEKGRKHIKENG